MCNRSPLSAGPLDGEAPLSPGRATHAPQDTETSFGGALRELRKRLRLKQILLAREIDCSEAAISHWESGARLPSAYSLGPTLRAFAAKGAATAEVLALRGLWRREDARRRLAARRS